jgi:DNA-binding NarL/FixJ family response regulator
MEDPILGFPRNVEDSEEGTVRFRGRALQTEVSVTKSIMIVDDSEMIRKQLRYYFASQSEFVICGEAVDGVDALEQAPQLHPDLIILDLAMPRMNGFETARKLRAYSPLLAIILFTGHADLLQAKEVATSGVNAVVPKSNLPKLKQQIDMLLK